MKKIGNESKAIKKALASPNNLGSFLYDVGYNIKGEKKTTNRAAIYVPTDGSVTYDSMNDYFRNQISNQTGIDSGLISLITSMRAEGVM